MLRDPGGSSTQAISGVLLPFPPRSNECGDASLVNAVEYIRELRRTATISWLASLFLVLGLSGLRVLPFHEFLPFLALLLGMIPIGIFVYRNEAVCEVCGGQMKISAGYPKIVHRCRRCQSEVHTGIHSDF